MAQQVIVLSNAWMLGTGLSGLDPGPSHVCEPDERGLICTMSSACAVLQRWRAERAAAAASRAAQVKP